MASSGAISAAYVADLERRLAEAEAARTLAETRLARAEEARARLERMVAQARREKFGAKSEKSGDPGQQHLPFEDLEVAEGMLAAATEAAERALGKRRTRTKGKAGNKGHLPEHLERIEQVLEPDSILCPCGCGEMVKVGADRTERLDVIPARLRVLVTIRPKYMCRTCAGKSHAQAPAPEWLVPRGLPTEALVAHSMVSKFGDYLPFYRQAGIYRRQGIELDRAMLAAWSGRAAELLAPVIDAMIGALRRSDRLQMDETYVPVLAPGTGKVRKDFLWAILRDQRGWGGADPPIVARAGPRTGGGRGPRSAIPGSATARSRRRCWPASPAAR